MQIDYGQALTNLVGLFFLIAVGYLSVHLKILSPSISLQLSRFLLKITLPCTIFTSLLQPYDPSFITDILIFLPVVVLLLLASAAVSALLARLCGVSAGKRGVWSFCATYSNFGFMGFPIVLALFGKNGLALATIFSLASNILVYSFGVKTVCTDCSSGEKQASGTNWGSLLLTSINCGTALGFLFYIFQLPVPEVILPPLTYLANVTTPLSMVLIGINMSEGLSWSTFTDKDILTATTARLVLIPGLSLAILNIVDKVIHFSNPLIIGVAFILMAMPAPAVSAILAESYGCDQMFASRVVFLSSLLSIVTIPLMSFLL